MNLANSPLLGGSQARPLGLAATSNSLDSCLWFGVVGWVGRKLAR